MGGVVRGMRRRDRRGELEKIPIQAKIAWRLVSEEFIAPFENYPVEIAQVLMRGMTILG